MTTHRDQFLNDCACIDFETTDLEPSTAEIIEQGISVYHDGIWSIACSQLHDCEASYVPPEASAVNNITKDMIVDKPLFSLDNFGLLQINPHRNIFVSHNSRYDSGVLEKYVDPETFAALQSNWLCSLRMVKKLHVNDPEFKGLNLAYMRYKLKLCVEVETEPHRAGYDSYINGLLLEYIVDVLERDDIINPDLPYLPQIKEWLSEPIIMERMNFGKHNGEKLSDIDFGYIKWAFEKADKCDENSSEYDKDLTLTLAIIIDKAYKG